MGTLATIYSATQTDAQRADLLTIARQLDTLATAFGHARPESIPSPASLRSTDPASRLDAWEGWYNGAPVTGSQLMPTSVLGQPTTTTPAAWSALHSLAQSRNAPSQVQAYLSVQGSSWDVARPNWSSSAPLSNAFNGAERAAQTWWYQRLGAASNTAAQWPRGDVSPTGAAIPPPVGTTPPPTHGGEDNTLRNLFLAGLVYLGIKHFRRA